MNYPKPNTQTTGSLSSVVEPGIDFVRIRFAGDSGDGIQLTGTLMADSAAHFGNDFATFPDYPAEIRAPVGTLYGVSSYSLNIGATEVMTHGDEFDVLVALNPAALKVHLPELRTGALVIIDTGTFNERQLLKAHMDTDPREDGTLDQYKVLEFDISTQTQEAVKPFGFSKKDSLRSKNMWVLGLVLWLFDRTTDSVESWLRTKFAKLPEVAEANVTALKAGHVFGEVAEVPAHINRYTIPPAEMEAGEYRAVNGSEALTMGLVAAAKLADLKLFYASYPITPASPLLHNLATRQNSDISTFQAEDEIAAACAAIGAAYAGVLAITGSSGPGIALKTEAIGLAVTTELPMIIVNVQRGGPSTGLPTKVEQSDLFQAVWGRNGDAPLPVIAARSPSDCFDCAIEAARIAVTYMTPVMLLSDGYIANAVEPWKLPDMDDGHYEPFPPAYANDPEHYQVFDRDPKTLARAWAPPGEAGFEHRIGGLEKDKVTGAVSTSAANHQHMTDMRRAKVMAVQNIIPDLEAELGKDNGRLAVLTWGSTYAPAHIAVTRELNNGCEVSHAHLRHIWPLPANLGSLLDRFDTILMPELNSGQLYTLLESQYTADFRHMGKVTGQLFTTREIRQAIVSILGEGK